MRVSLSELKSRSRTRIRVGKLIVIIKRLSELKSTSRTQGKLKRLSELKSTSRTHGKLIIKRLSLYQNLKADQGLRES